MNKLNKNEYDRVPVKYPEGKVRIFKPSGCWFSFNFGSGTLFEVAAFTTRDSMRQKFFSFLLSSKKY